MMHDKHVRAIKWLEKAIDLHAGHMDGSVPTSEASQKELMHQIERAYALLEGMSPREEKMMDGKTIAEGTRRGPN